MDLLLLKSDVFLKGYSRSMGFSPTKLKQSPKEMKALKIFIIILLFVIFYGIGYLSGCLHDDARVKEVTLARISARLGIQEDWDSVYEYVYCDIFQINKPRTQVEKELLHFEPFMVLNEGYGNVMYQFQNVVISERLRTPSIWYNEQGQLESKAIWIGLDYLEIACP